MEKTAARNLLPISLLLLALFCAILFFAGFGAKQAQQPSAGNPALWYFAYGSNLHQPTMLARVGNWSSAMPATLYGYSRVFASRFANSTPYANIVRSANSSVDGALYLISQDSARTLDYYEGVPANYVRINVTAFANKTSVQAYAYQYSGGGFPSRPSQNYLWLISEGLRSFGYPDEIIEEAVQPKSPMPQ